MANMITEVVILAIKNLLRPVVELVSQHHLEILNRISQLESKIDKVMALETTLDQQITDLTTAVTSETAIEQSAVTLINGIPALIAAAIAKASAAGATTAQLQAISDLQDKLTASSTSLASAITANTPASS